ncbi:MAG: hypothetical protein GX896_03375 [Clostridiales bacterium]|nr:hypothetical protein [Clostridiales bacterium]
MSKYNFLDAIDRGEIVKFLQGQWPYKIESPNYVAGIEPDYIRQVLKEAVYGAYEIDLTVRSKFEQAIIQMLDGDAYGVYIGAMYGMLQKINELDEKSPFKIDEDIMPQIRRKLIRNQESFRMGISGCDGYYNSDPWGDIQKYNDECHFKYGFEVI